MIPDQQSKQISREITVRAKTFGADLAGIAQVEALKTSPSHRISERLPVYDGVGTTATTEEKHGLVRWPADAGAAVVIAVAHPVEKPELDWWITHASSGNTAGNRLLMTVVDRLAAWLDRQLGIRCFKLPYHIERGGVYMKDAAVMGGLGCIGKNNMLVTPQFGPRLRLRVMLIDADLPSTGPSDFDPCLDCPMPCRKACTQQAFSKTVYSAEAYHIDSLPGRTGRYDRIRCNRQMLNDETQVEMIAVADREMMGAQVKYCRACELACPVGQH